VRDLDSRMEAAFTDGSTTNALLAEFDFESETLYMWSGYGSLVYDGKTYLGGGNLINISPYQETQELQAQGLQFSLSGVPTTLISTALQESYQGRECRTYIATVNLGDGALLTGDGGYILQENGSKISLEAGVLSAYRYFTGLMDTIDISDDASESRIVLSAENILTILKRRKASYYTHEEQIALYPKDLGFVFVPSLQDKEIIW